MKTKITLFAAMAVFAFGISQSAFAQNLVINEFMASNDNALAGPQGDYPDWIEIYNPTSDSVMLGGYFMADDLNDTSALFEISSMYPDSVTVAPYSFILFYANKEDASSVLNLNFKLGSSGEQVGLWSPSMMVIDTITYGQQEADTSFGRTVDAGMSWVKFYPSTPMMSNMGGTISIPTNDAIDNKLEVYPNPATGDVVNFNKEVNVEIFNIAGQSIMVENNVTRINVATLEAGIYFVKTDNDEVVRLIVQ